MGILQKMVHRFASIFTRKSIGEKVWARLFGGYGAWGLPGAWGADRRELALHYRGWSYIAVRVIAEEIAALQPQVGFVRSPQDYEERIGEVLKSCHPGRERQAEQAFRKRFRSKSAVRKSLAQLQEHEEIELVDNDHRLLRLLRNPNNWDTGYTFWFRTSMQLDIHGNFYWWCIPDGVGKTCEIWVLPSNWVWPSPNRNKEEIVSYYEVRPYGTPGAASSFVIPAEEIVHGMYPGPISMWDGFSPQTAMAPWIDVLESMDACQFAGFKNGVGFDATIELDAAMEDPEQATLKRLQERLKERSGEGHHKEPLVMAPGAKLTYPRGVAPYEMDYAGSGDQKKDWVLAGWGVSKFMAGLSEDVNKASSRTAVANFFRKVIRPRLLLIDGYATENLARELDDRLIVYHDDPTADDPEELRAQLTLEIQAKSVMINEIRTAFGREPIEGGDVIIGTPTDTPLLGPDAAENADELGEILATLKEAQQPEQPGMPGMPGMNGNGRSETGPTSRLPQAERNGKQLETVSKGASHWHKTFNESDHPRDEGGKFGSGGGGAAAKPEEQKPEEQKPAKPENKLSRYETGKKLTPEERRKVLESVRDVYKEMGLEKNELKGYQRDSGDPIYGYPHAPEHFVTSDITGAKVRHYITLPGGKKAHPSELFPNIKQSDIDKHYHEQAANKKRSEEMNRSRDLRVAATKNDANYQYNTTNRSLEGSFFAKHPDGRIVRVDGNDAEDVKYYEEQGFKQITPPRTTTE